MANQPDNQEPKRRFWQPKMTWAEAQDKVNQDWRKAEAIDRRGMLIGRLIFAASIVLITFSTNWLEADFQLSRQEAVPLFLGILMFWVIKYYMLLINMLGYIFDDILASGVVTAFSFAGGIGTAYGFSIGFGFGVAGGVLVGLGFAYGFAIAIAYGFVGGFGVAGGVAGGFVIGYAGGGVFAGAGGGIVGGIVGYFVGGFYGLIVKNIFKRTTEFHNRSNKTRDFLMEQNRLEPVPENSPSRQHLLEHSAYLVRQKDGLTAGFAGRRGMGKTNILKNICEAQAPSGRGLEESDLTQRALQREQRLSTITLSLHTPTEFKEMNFLSALLEQFTQRINQLLTTLLPAVEPYMAERELQEKRRLLKIVHYGYVVLFILLCIAGTLAYVNNLRIDHLYNLSGLQKIPEAVSEQSHNNYALYVAMRDSLAGIIETKIQPYQDTLQVLHQLLNPSPLDTSDWNFNKEDFPKNQFKISATLDSLKRWQNWPQPSALDSLDSLSRKYFLTLKTITEIEVRYQQVEYSLNGFVSRVESNDATIPVRYKSGLEQFSYYGWLLITLGFLVYFWRDTQEGSKRFRRKEYDSMRNEIALYGRTNELLDRLRYHISFGEGEETQARGGIADYCSLSRRKLRSTTREMRPYTILSLIEEYRNYVQEVQHYLNEALKVDAKKDEKITPVKIIIAIDELDKVLNTQRLHEMLKSIKAIFDIPHVYYLLSISEDALETYRLRHVETKNEIDSAFTHIFEVPPLDVRASLIFYVEQKPDWSVELLPAAVVFPGGVPRDMHRLHQTFSLHQEWQDLPTCLAALWAEDRKAVADLVELNSGISDVWKQRWIERVNTLECDTPEAVDALLKEIASYNFAEFEQENPLPPEKAKTVFHQVNSLVRAMAIKRYIYHQLANLKQPAALQRWPEDPAQFVEHIERKKSLEPWLTKLNHYRDAIFHLSGNPLGVWERVKSQH